MEQFNAILALVGTGSPAISVIALFACYRLYRDNKAMTERFIAAAEKAAVASEKVASLLETLRELVRER